MKYLSFGAGVNSIALYVYFLQEGLQPGRDFEAVFADPGAEYPETYQYITWMQEAGFPVTVVEGRYRGGSYDGMNLLDFCTHLSILPSVKNRWCTDKFKVRPLFRYMGETTHYLGIACGDKRYHRYKGNPRDRSIEMPLYEEGIDRQGCKDLIADFGWPQPCKSGCFFCPQQRVGEWERLARDHPDLFRIALAMEDAAVERQQARGKPPYYFTRVPLRVLASGPDARRFWRAEQKGQLNFMDDIGLDPCGYCRL